MEKDCFHLVLPPRDSNYTQKNIEATVKYGQKKVDSIIVSSYRRKPENSGKSSFTPGP